MANGEGLGMPLRLAQGEAEEYVGLPRDVVLQRYMRRHKDEKCPFCLRFIGNHSLKQFSNCANHDEMLARLEPEEVPLIRCPACKELVPPAFACIKCGEIDI